MFSDIAQLSIQGFVGITDRLTGEVLADTHNDVLYGNMSTALAYSLVGNPDSLLYYMAFGNGGSFVNITGLAYRPSLGGASSSAKNPTANLYNTLYVKKLSNFRTRDIENNSDAITFITNQSNATNYEDISISVIINPSEPPSGINPTNEITFNEIGLFAGSSNLFNGFSTENETDISTFLNAAPNFSTVAGAKSKLMLTHVIFNPITKATIQSLEIKYTLRIQMGSS
jgi:hypothetical protein